MFTKKCIYKKYIYIGIIIINLLATGAHSLYELTGKFTAIGVITPINESIWEHVKIGFYPTLLWWLISFIFISKSREVDFKKWFIAMAISCTFTSYMIVTFYYTYTGALGIHSMILDITSLILGVILGQLLSLWYLNKGNYSPMQFSLSLIILCIFIFSFTYFTFNPPNFPIFIDSTTGLRGIYLIK